VRALHTATSASSVRARPAGDHSGRPAPAAAENWNTSCGAATWTDTDQLSLRRGGSGSGSGTGWGALEASAPATSAGPGCPACATLCKGLRVRRVGTSRNGSTCAAALRPSMPPGAGSLRRSLQARSAVVQARTAGRCGLAPYGARTRTVGPSPDAGGAFSTPSASYAAIECCGVRPLWPRRPPCGVSSCWPAAGAATMERCAPTPACAWSRTFASTSSGRRVCELPRRAWHAPPDGCARVLQDLALAQLVEAVCDHVANVRPWRARVAPCW
jgi:hypothetical protein